jgi:hypothetical protein
MLIHPSFQLLDSYANPPNLSLYEHEMQPESELQAIYVKSLYAKRNMSRASPATPAEI